MRTADFDFDLPDDRIALRPPARREDARLLHVARDALADRQMTDLPDLLRAGDVLVLNDTRVLAAALRGVRPARPTGGGGPAQIDVNLLAPLGEVRWRCLVRPAKRLRPGDLVDFGGSGRTQALTGLVETREGAEVVFRFATQGDLAAAFDAAGFMPLPPYIARQRPADETDRTRYQTVFAREPGSVAAPTAGLHLTDGLLDTVKAKGVRLAMLTLHVGAGTFLPVKTEDTDDHAMHAERGRVSEEAAETIRGASRVVCVGTTSLRLVETAARGGEVRPFDGETDLFITPGFRFRACDVLLTNFHLPRSTLFMLTCAFAGTERMKAAYAHAVRTGYRFYSYGDACLLERDPDAA